MDLEENGKGRRGIDKTVQVDNYNERAAAI
jgi:hypothetical protein